MKIECTSEEQKQMIDVLADSTLCLFEGKVCTWHGNCDGCLRDRIEWVIEEDEQHGTEE